MRELNTKQLMLLNSAMLEAGMMPSKIHQAIQNIRKGLSGAVLPEAARNVLKSQEFKDAANVVLHDQVILDRYINGVNNYSKQIQKMMKP